MTNQIIDTEIKEKIIHYLQDLKFVDLKLVKSSISERKCSIINEMRLNELSIFSHWTHFEKHIGFSCINDFALTIYHNKNKTENIRGRCKYAYFLYNIPKNMLQVTFLDSQFSLTIRNKSICIEKSHGAYSLAYNLTQRIRAKKLTERCHELS